MYTEKIFTSRWETFERMEENLRGDPTETRRERRWRGRVGGGGREETQKRSPSSDLREDGEEKCVRERERDR